MTPQTIHIRRRHPVAGLFALCLIGVVSVAITVHYWAWAPPVLGIFIGWRVLVAGVRCRGGSARRVGPPI